HGDTIDHSVNIFSVINIYIYMMRRIIHQRNSFNNCNRMIGGMEDEERARRQREWAEWRESQLREWEREQLLQRKRQYRRERDDIKRGTGK
ncbi:MAG: hypothetical protein ACKPKO_51980, partial [Candidatus Fonsibacter sp.]